MPKENNHLYVANLALSRLPEGRLKDLIIRHQECFYLGSITPDLFYYSKKPEVAEISEYLHGRDGNSTSEIILSWLEAAKMNRSDEDLAFVMGYLTHYASDITFHPVIIFLTGNPYHRDGKKSSRALYQHRLLETCLDRELNGVFFLDELIRPGVLKQLGAFSLLAERFGVELAEFSLALERMIKFNRLFRSVLVFKVLYYLNKLLPLHLEDRLALFYGMATKDQIKIPKEVLYRDIVSNQETRITRRCLADNLLSFIEKLISTAGAYYFEAVSRDEVAAVISDRSLITGKSSCPASEIRYTL